MIFKKFFDNEEVSKLDVIMHVGAALVAIYKAADKYKTYHSQEKHAL